MAADSSNPFYDPSERQYRRSSNSRSFFDDDDEPSPNNPFYDNPPKPGVYRRGGGAGHSNGTSSNNRQELFGGSSEPKPKLLFDEDEDDFDVDTPFDAEAYRQQLLMKKMRESANRQMDSQQRSLAVIEDSEQMGVTTAEELLRQREQLDNVERKTADINQTMDVSTKHVDKISSIFSGVKGWFKRKDGPPVEAQIPDRGSGLQDTVEAYKATPMDKNQHPAVRMRDEDRSRDPASEAKMTSQDIYRQYDDQYNRNLDMMSHGLSRLKGLGLVLQTEIETQNDQIERINTNVAKADDKVVTQTKRINNMLKK